VHQRKRASGTFVVADENPLKVRACPSGSGPTLHTPLAPLKLLVGEPYEWSG